jgi:hypothetical protein
MIFFSFSSFIMYVCDTDFFCDLSRFYNAQNKKPG